MDAQSEKSRKIISVNKFVVDPSDSGIWNRVQLEKFLVDNQYTDIYLTISEGPDCDAIGLFELLDLYEFKTVRVETFNAIQLPHANYSIVDSPNKFYFFETIKTDDAQYKEYHQWNKNKIFSVFYNRPSWHRIGLASYMQTQHKNKTLMNFRYDPQDQDCRNQFDLNQLFVHDPVSVTMFGNCQDQFPVRLESADGYTKGASTETHTDQLCKFYSHALIDIVAETFINGTTFFATEKTVRPMLLKKPFIAMAAQDHLLYLRQMGFRTFSDFWDEDYDGVADGNRYKKILKLIDTLAAKSVNELDQMYKSMQNILDHNYSLLIEQNYSKIINYVK